jgi:hypothetical protein
MEDINQWSFRRDMKTLDMKSFVVIEGVVAA